MLSAETKYKDNASYWNFHQQILHTSLVKILDTLKPGMTMPQVVQFPNGHYQKIIYGLGPYIMEYPKQALLMCIVQGRCPN